MADTNNSIVNVQQITTTPSTLAISADHVAQFNALLKSTRNMSDKNTASLDRKIDEAPLEDEGVFKNQILKIQESEFLVGRLHRHLKGGIEDLRLGHTLDGSMVRSVTNLTFASSYYFLGTSRIANAAQDVSDEITSVTRGK